jgi:SAM-dependent methyltransferase
MRRDTYTHGHHDSVLRSHRWRTAENSAGYLLPHLRAGDDLLDVGCGPGTITLDLARRVAPGRVVGLDAAAEVVAEAMARLDAEPAPGATFVEGSVYELQWDDASFDVVHAHQVLQHLTDPVAALGEMRRVLRPGGLLAVRDGDYGGFLWAPADAALDRWLALYHEVTARNGAEADAGRHLPGWVRAAGFRDLEVSSSAWTFADREARGWWGELWAERVERSAFAEQALAYGLSDPAELAAIAAAWRAWAAAPDGVFVTPHVEVLARR